MKTRAILLVAMGVMLSVVGTWPLAGWAADTYILSVQQLRAGLMKAPTPAAKGFILVDVRSPEEHATGFIPGTDRNIDFRELKSRHRELGADVDDHIVVYCQSGHRSGIAAETLANLGYRFVYNVSGSLNAWMEAGYPVERGR